MVVIVVEQTSIIFVRCIFGKLDTAGAPASEANCTWIDLCSVRQGVFSMARVSGNGGVKIIVQNDSLFFKSSLIGGLHELTEVGGQLLALFGV